MRNVFKILFLVILFNIAAKANAGNKGVNPGVSSENSINNNNDSAIGIKSNIVIFKIISTPSSSNNNSNGSLKKAGKVARTSYSHSSIENILTKNKGI